MTGVPVEVEVGTKGSGSVLFGTATAESPWLTLELLSKRGWSISITAGHDRALRATAARASGAEGVLHVVEGDSIEELAVLLAGWIRAWERS